MEEANEENRHLKKNPLKWTWLHPLPPVSPCCSVWVLEAISCSGSRLGAVPWL